MAVCGSAAEWSGKVVGIKDGDTLEILRGRIPVVVRLHGIDCPELAQPFGRKAKNLSGALAFNKTVTVIERSRDRYNRSVAEIILPSRENLAHALLKQGLAWWYRKYAPRDSTLRLLEESARDRRLGLWADPNPIPPWLWRR